MESVGAMERSSSATCAGNHRRCVCVCVCCVCKQALEPLACWLDCCHKNRGRIGRRNHREIATSSHDGKYATQFSKTGSDRSERSKSANLNWRRLGGGGGGKALHRTAVCVCMYLCMRASLHILIARSFDRLGFSRRSNRLCLCLPCRKIK